MDPTKFVTPEAVSQYGIGTILFVVVVILVLHYYFVRWPEVQKAQLRRDEAMIEQMAQGRQALETSNLVIVQNNQFLQEASSSSHRVGERLECVEDVLTRHDARAEKIGLDTTRAAANTEAIRSKLGA